MLLLATQLQPESSPTVFATELQGEPDSRPMQSPTPEEGGQGRGSDGAERE